MCWLRCVCESADKDHDLSRNDHRAVNTGNTHGKKKCLTDRDREPSLATVWIPRTLWDERYSNLVVRDVFFWDWRKVAGRGAHIWPSSTLNGDDFMVIRCLVHTRNHLVYREIDRFEIAFASPFDDWLARLIICIQSITRGPRFGQMKFHFTLKSYLCDHNIYIEITMIFD